MHSRADFFRIYNHHQLLQPILARHLHPHTDFFRIHNHHQLFSLPWPGTCTLIWISLCTISLASNHPKSHPKSRAYCSPLPRLGSKRATSGHATARTSSRSLRHSPLDLTAHQLWLMSCVVRVVYEGANTEVTVWELKSTQILRRKVRTYN